MSFDSFLTRTRKFSKKVTVTCSIAIVAIDLPENGSLLNCLSKNYVDFMQTDSRVTKEIKDPL